MTSDAGALLLHAVEKGLGLVARLRAVLRDRRNASYTEHNRHKKIVRFTGRFQTFNNLDNLV